MDKLGKKTRSFSFYSTKNDDIVCLHSKITRDYAKYLEEQSWVETYEVEVPLHRELYMYVKRTGIRGTYFEVPWYSDFLIHFTNGQKGIHELVLSGDLQKKSEVEKLEFSRRYWAATDVDEWKIVLLKEDKP